MAVANLPCNLARLSYLVTHTSRQLSDICLSTLLQVERNVPLY